MVWFILILGFLYVITGLISHIINIYQFFADRDNDDPYEAYKKKKLNG